MMAEEARLKGSEPPFRKAKELLDLIKVLAAIVIALVGFGWWVSQYLGEFQTKQEAEKAQSSTERSIRELQQQSVAAHDEQFRQRYTLIQVGLEVRNTNDRLKQLIETQQANTAAERRAAEREVARLQDQIRRREQVLGSPARLEAATRSPDAVTTLEGL